MIVNKAFKQNISKLRAFILKNMIYFIAFNSAIYCINSIGTGTNVRKRIAIDTYPAIL